MQVEQVDFVSVPTRDIPRAVAFYRDVLELRESAFTEGEVEVGDLTLAGRSVTGMPMKSVRSTPVTSPSQRSSGA